MARDGSISGGRKKGSKNKKTIEQLDRAERLLQLLEAEHLADDVKSISAGQRMNIYNDLLEYKAPKLSRIDHNVKANINLSDEPITFE